jgi:hypothetical protein
VLAGMGDSIIGGSGDMLISGGSHDTIIGGSGAITIQGGVDDSIVAGSGGIISVHGHGGSGHGHVQGFSNGDTIAGTEGLTFLDPAAGASTVTGFSTDFDSIQSSTSVSPSGTFVGSSTSSSSGTTLAFVDGATIFLAGVVDIGEIKFTR